MARASTKSSKSKVASKPKQMAATVPAAAAPSKTPLGKLNAVLPWLLAICGVLGTIAALVITQDKFDLAQNPHFQPVCDLNPIISCGSVMKSHQADAFGFMNPYIGLLGFPVVITVGMAMVAGAKFKRWFWVSMQLGLTLGVAFAYWLLFESVYRIRALCPWCLTVDVALTTAWWYTTLFVFYNGFLRWPARWQKAGQFIKRHHTDILVFWFLLVIALILKHFWYYFGQQL
ncbi:MAG TPA: vitamin K epoxide reductase family protein [Candidatus Saccharimonadales bacterium]|nr:vitamin K epoxide reductase family protein [Candidatus Saccharimonadales bacterium]